MKNYKNFGSLEFSIKSFTMYHQVSTISQKNMRSKLLRGRVLNTWPLLSGLIESFLDKNLFSLVGKCSFICLKCTALSVILCNDYTDLKITGIQFILLILRWISDILCDILGTGRSENRAFINNVEYLAPLVILK